MSNIIFMKEGQPCTTSRIIAQTFGKRHSDVLKAIKNLEIDEEIGQRNFALSSYLNEQNKPQPEYIITRDGFTLLVMGFTGKEAMKFKVEFIKAFNAMEQALKDASKPLNPLSPAEALLQSVQMLVAQEKRLNQVETKVDTLVQRQQMASQELSKIERSTEVVPELSTRNKIRKIVNQFVFATGAKYNEIYNLIYDRLYYNYHVNLRAVNKYKAENLLDVAERLGHLDKIYTIVSHELNTKRLA